MRNTVYIIHTLKHGDRSIMPSDLLQHVQEDMKERRIKIKEQTCQRLNKLEYTYFKMA